MRRGTDEDHGSAEAWTTAWREGARDGPEHCRPQRPADPSVRAVRQGAATGRSFARFLQRVVPTVVAREALGQEGRLNPPSHAGDAVPPADSCGAAGRRVEGDHAPGRASRAWRPRGPLAPPGRRDGEAHVVAGRAPSRSRRCLRCSRGRCHGGRRRNRAIQMGSGVPAGLQRRPGTARAHGTHYTCSFLLDMGDHSYLFRMNRGNVEDILVVPGPLDARYQFAIRASAGTWRRFAREAPEPMYHGIFAASFRRDVRLEGDVARADAEPAPRGPSSRTDAEDRGRRSTPPGRRERSGEMARTPGAWRAVPG